MPQTHDPYADDNKWPDDMRGEIIGGRFFDLAPDPSGDHQALHRVLFGELYKYLVTATHKNRPRNGRAGFVVR